MSLNSAEVASAASGTSGSTNNIGNKTSTGNSSSSALHISSEQDKFLFDCDHLVMFCTQSEQSDIADQTDTVLDVKLEDLETRCAKLQTTYETLMLSSTSSNTKDFRDNAKININASSEAYSEYQVHILDQTQDKAICLHM